MTNLTKWIKNFTTYRDLNKILNDPTSGPVWEFEINIPLTMKPMEVIIRQICYVPAASTNSCFLIWSSLNNGFIGAVTDDFSTVSTPQTTIILQAQLVGPIKFQIYELGTHSNIKPLSSGNGKLAISFDVIGA